LAKASTVVTDPPLCHSRGQDRRRDRPVLKRQGHHDRYHDEGVAAGRFLVALATFNEPS
jgi:hypothetical protein